MISNYRFWLPLFLMVLCRQASSSALLMTEEIVSEQGQIVGFRTEDPYLSYLIPDSWQIYQDKVFLRRSDDLEFPFDLAFILAPQYDKAWQRVSQVLEEEPEMEFLPLPSVFEQASLNLPDLLAIQKVALTPEPQDNQSPLLYFKMAMTADQLDLLRTLSQGGLALTGSMIYRFAGPSGDQQTTVAMAIDLKAEHMMVRPRPDQWGSEWISYQLFRHELNLSGVFDGSYSLGSLGIDLTDTELRGQVISASSQVRAEGSLLKLVPKAANFQAQIALSLPLLNLRIEWQSWFRLGLTYDRQNLDIQVDQLTIVPDLTPQGDNHEWMALIVGNILDNPATLKVISNRLTEEFRRRLVNQNLFWK